MMITHHDSHWKLCKFSAPAGASHSESDRDRARPASSQCSIRGFLAAACRLAVLVTGSDRASLRPIQCFGLGNSKFGQGLSLRAADSDGPGPWRSSTDSPAARPRVGTRRRIVTRPGGSVPVTPSRSEEGPERSGETRPARAGGRGPAARPGPAAVPQS